MRRRFFVAAVVVLALVSGATAALPPAAQTNKAAARHKLIVAVERTLPPAAEKRLAVLVLIRQDGGAPAGAVATPGRSLAVLLQTNGSYRVKAEINASCEGTCAASYRISGSADHKLEVVPSCRPKKSGFACSKIRIVKLD